MKYPVLTLVGKIQMYGIPYLFKALQEMNVPPETIIVSCTPELGKQIPESEIPVRIVSAKGDKGDSWIYSTTAAREKLRQVFLEEYDYEWSLWLDSDLLPPEDLIEQFKVLRVKYPEVRFFRSFHPARQGDGCQLRHGMGSSFVHRDVLATCPFTYIKYRDRYWGDDQIFLSIVTTFGKLFPQTKIVKSGLLFNFRHVRDDGYIITLKDREIKWQNTSF